MRRPLIVLLVLAALAPTSAMASDWYRCRADGGVRQACCCPDADDREAPAPDAPPGLERPCCCDVDRIDARASDLRARSEDGSVAVGLAVPIETVTARPATPAPVVVVTTATPARPRGPPPPLFLRNCSLLL